MSEELELRKEIAKILTESFGFGADEELEARLLERKDGVVDKLFAIVDRAFWDGYHQGMADGGTIHGN